MTTQTTPGDHHATTTRTRWSWAPALSAVAGVTGSALIFLVGNTLSSTAGTGVTAQLLDNQLRLHAVAWLAALTCGGLILASSLLARAATGTPGRVIAASGPAVAVLMLAYYASFAAGATVAANGLTEAGPGLGEATLVVLNAFSLTLIGPALAVVAAGAVSRSLPRATRVTAVVLAVLLLVPFTSWVANLILPLWLGLAAATTRRS